MSKIKIDDQILVENGVIQPTATNVKDTFDANRVEHFVKTANDMSEAYKADTKPVSEEHISKRTLKMIKRSVKNVKKGKVGKQII